jgi:hypothetical protein
MRGLLALVLIAGCGGHRPVASTPAPPAAADAGPESRPTAVECAAVLDHLAALRGIGVDAIAASDREAFLGACQAEARARDLACALAAPDLAAVSRCASPE